MYLLHYKATFLGPSKAFDIVKSLLFILLLVQIKANLVDSIGHFETKISNYQSLEPIPITQDSNLQPEIERRNGGYGSSTNKAASSGAGRTQVAISVERVKNPDDDPGPYKKKKKFPITWLRNQYPFNSYYKKKKKQTNKYIDPLSGQYSTDNFEVLDPNPSTWVRIPDRPTASIKFSKQAGSNSFNYVPQAPILPPPPSLQMAPQLDEMLPLSPELLGLQSQPIPGSLMSGQLLPLASMQPAPIGPNQQPIGMMTSESQNDYSAQKQQEPQNGFGGISLSFGNGRSISFGGGQGLTIGGRAGAISIGGKNNGDNTASASGQSETKGSYGTSYTPASSSSKSSNSYSSSNYEDGYVSKHPTMSVDVPRKGKTIVHANLDMAPIKFRLHSSPRVKITTGSRDPLEKPSDEELTENEEDIFEPPEPFPKKNETSANETTTLSPGSQANMTEMTTLSPLQIEQQIQQQQLNNRYPPPVYDQRMPSIQNNYQPNGFNQFQQQVPSEYHPNINMQQYQQRPNLYQNGKQMSPPDYIQRPIQHNTRDLSQFNQAPPHLNQPQQHQPQYNTHNIKLGQKPIEQHVENTGHGYQQQITQFDEPQSHMQFNGMPQQNQQQFHPPSQFHQYQAQQHQQQQPLVTNNQANQQMNSIENGSPAVNQWRQFSREARQQINQIVPKQQDLNIDNNPRFYNGDRSNSNSLFEPTNRPDMLLRDSADLAASGNQNSYAKIALNSRGIAINSVQKTHLGPSTEYQMLQANKQESIRQGEDNTKIDAKRPYSSKDNQKIYTTKDSVQAEALESNHYSSSVYQPVMNHQAHRHAEQSSYSNQNQMKTYTFGRGGISTHYGNSGGSHDQSSSGGGGSTSSDGFDKKNYAAKVEKFDPDAHDKRERSKVVLFLRPRISIHMANSSTTTKRPKNPQRFINVVNKPIFLNSTNATHREEEEFIDPDLKEPMDVSNSYGYGYGYGYGRGYSTKGTSSTTKKPKPKTTTTTTTTTTTASSESESTTSSSSETQGTSTTSSDSSSSEGTTTSITTTEATTTTSTTTSAPESSSSSTESNEPSSTSESISSTSTTESVTSESDVSSTTPAPTSQSSSADSNQDSKQEESSTESSSSSEASSQESKGSLDGESAKLTSSDQDSGDNSEAELVASATEPSKVITSPPVPTTTTTTTTSTTTTTTTRRPPAKMPIKSRASRTSTTTSTSTTTTTTTTTTTPAPTTTEAVMEETTTTAPTTTTTPTATPTSPSTTSDRPETSTEMSSSTTTSMSSTSPVSSTSSEGDEFIAEPQNPSKRSTKPERTETHQQPMLLNPDLIDKLMRNRTLVGLMSGQLKRVLDTEKMNQEEKQAVVRQVFEQMMEDKVDFSMTNVRLAVKTVSSSYRAAADKQKKRAAASQVQVPSASNLDTQNQEQQIQTTSAKSAKLASSRKVRRMEIKGFGSRATGSPQANEDEAQSSRLQTSSKSFPALDTAIHLSKRGNSAQSATSTAPTSETGSPASGRVDASGNPIVVVLLPQDKA